MSVTEIVEAIGELSIADCVDLTKTIRERLLEGDDPAEDAGNPAVPAGPRTSLGGQAAKEIKEES